MDNANLAYLLVGAAAGAAAAWGIVRSGLARRAPKPAELRGAYAAAEALQPFLRQLAHPRDLLEDQRFERGVQALLAESAPPERLAEYAVGTSAALAAMALEALARRGADSAARAAALSALGTEEAAPFYFALRCLGRVSAPGEAQIGPVLAHLDESWEWNEPKAQSAYLREFLAERLAAAESPTFGNALAGADTRSIELVRAALKRLGKEIRDPLLGELDRIESERVDLDFFTAIGPIWKTESESWSRELLDHPALLAELEELRRLLLAPRPTSVLLVGENGVGKTSLVRRLACRLADDGVKLFEAGAAELVAGQSYWGQFEERLKQLARRLEGAKRLIWFVPNLAPLLDAGRHQENRQGTLDFLFPYLEAGKIRIVAEVDPEGFDRILREKPRPASAMSVRRFASLTETETLALGRAWAERHAAAPGRPRLPPALLAEAWKLVRQYRGDLGSPGCLLELLQRALLRSRGGGAQEEREIGLDDLLLTLSEATGLPASILDDREGLDLEALRELFERSVLGQDEAVAALVERIAMIKAGVCDPSRPYGVFLFAGPTGTGKTEIAKSLAEFLFGSPERLARVDMSELQTPDALGRLIGERHGDPGRSLVDRIRKEPFSVVLLDEFEKAHPNVWDLFLQLFDDGRLTDALGRTADFRHSIVILTSNLGASIQSGPGVGFSASGAAFTAHEVERALERTFRPELRNRLDRIVIFRPLSREVMRRLAEKELAEVFERRGLRNRSWLVEWSPDALELLLEHGFTPHLGARPLKRAVERLLLVPLALATSRKEIPEGEQLLFIERSGDRLAVRFVPADGGGDRAPDDAARAGSEAPELALSLASLALRPVGNELEVERIAHELERISRRFHSGRLAEERAAALTLVASDEFWTHPERRSILTLIERTERVERYFASAADLGARLEARAGRADAALARDLIARLADRCRLLDAALSELAPERSWDVLLVLASGPRPAGANAPHLAAFARELAAMYRAWAERVGARWLELGSLGLLAGARGEAFAVSGFAAHALLEAENGLHLSERPDGRGGFERYLVEVAVVAQPPEVAADAVEPLRAAARAALARRAAGAPPQVVRRYRREPSPLVRDAVRGYRTGRLDLVLAGRFDLFEGRTDVEEPTA